jgi:cyanobactin maturation PatA/PatG family protease
VFATRPGARAITQAVEHRANVINISGGQLSDSIEPDPLLANALRLCAENNVLIVAAAGNDGCDCLHLPAAVDTVLAVGAMDSTASPLPSSNWGKPYLLNGVLAPGKDIVGAVPGGGVAARSGTSYAAAIVSGVAGLLLSAELETGTAPDPMRVRTAILTSALPCPEQSVLDCGRYLAGRLDVGGMLEPPHKHQKDISLRGGEAGTRHQGRRSRPWWSTNSSKLAKGSEHERRR